MQRMTGMDAAFLAMETRSSPMHTLKVLVLEPVAGASTSPSLGEALEAGIRERLHLVPALRRRVLDVPLGLHRPLWIEDPDFELRAHLRHRVLPAPGGEAELDALVAEIAAAPLDRRRPLWEMWAVEGLASGASAVIVKVHHALADGVTAARMIAAALGEPAGSAPGAEARGAWSPDPIPGARELLVAALRERAGQLASLGPLVRETRARLAALRRHHRETSLRPPRPILDTPRTPFNRSFGAARSFASTTLPLEALAAIKRARGVTLNDVVLALVSGALRAFLLARGALPESALVASVPTAAERAPGAAGGNHVSSLFVSLETHRADPLERLHAIHASAAAAKADMQVMGAGLLESWSAYLPALGPVTEAAHALGLANRVRAPLNLVVSNVPGPAAELQAPGHRLAAIYSVGPLLESIGLNVTAWSYQGALHVSVLAAREGIPDARPLAAALHDALAELRAAVERG